MTEKHLIKWFENWNHNLFHNRPVKGRNVSVCDARKIQNTCSHNEYRRGESGQLSILQDVENLYQKYPQQGEARRLSPLIRQIEPGECSDWPSESAGESWITQAIVGLPGFQAGPVGRFGVIAHFGGAVL